MATDHVWCGEPGLSTVSAEVRDFVGHEPRAIRVMVLTSGGTSFLVLRQESCNDGFCMVELFLRSEVRLQALGPPGQ